jgi:hypothetical protein
MLMLAMTSTRRIKYVAAAVGVASVVISASVARADTFGGFAAKGALYLLGTDKVCQPLVVQNAMATGVASCQITPLDQVAAQRFAVGTDQRGTTAEFTAQTNGTTLTVSQSGVVAVTWENTAPMGKVQWVQASRYGDRIAVGFAIRRLGRDMTDVVVFALSKKVADKAPDVTPAATDAPPPPLPAATQALLKKARGYKGKAAVKAWGLVLQDQPELAEARYGVASGAAQTKDIATAMQQLQSLRAAVSKDGTAIEWLVAARFDKSFAALRDDAAFRKVVGLDASDAPSAYEQVMGFGGSWEQTGTSCESPTVAMVFTRERTVSIRVRSMCQGMSVDSRFKGTWKTTAGPVVKLSLPNKDKAADAVTCNFEMVGQEQGLVCPLDEELVLRVLPARR